METRLVVGSAIDRRARFGTRPFARGHKVGERISRREAARRAAGRRRIGICDIDASTSIDASVGRDATASINHSCEPNLFTRVVAARVLFFALRDIAAGQELTVDREEKPHSDPKRCRCGSPRCRGRLNRGAG